jgi:hypothetical protein
MVKLAVGLSGAHGKVFGNVKVSLGTKALCNGWLAKGSVKCMFDSHALGHGNNTLTVSYTGEGWYKSLAKHVMVKTS